MSENDETKEATGGVSEETAPSTKTSNVDAFLSAKQNMKDMIHITDGNDVDDSEDFVDIDDDDTEGEVHPALKAVDNLTSSVRGNFEKHVAPKVDEFVSNTQYLLDTHVAPQVTKVQENTAKVLGDVQTHSSRMIKDVQHHSSRAVQGVQENTKKTLEAVDKSTKKALENTQKSTQEFHEKQIKPKLDKAGKDIEEFSEKNIKPHIDNFMTESSLKMEQTGGCLAKSWQSTKHYVLKNKPYYWNTAPELFDNNTESSSPWYLVLEEATCRAYSRTIFCDNPVTGIMIFLAILLSSPLAGVCSLISVVMTNLTALYLDMNRQKLCHGWYAANSVLIGTGLVDYFSFDSMLGGGWPVQVFLSILLAPMTLLVGLWLQHKVLSETTPILLLPYNIVMFATLLCAKVWDATMISKVDIATESMMDASDLDGVDAELPSRYFGYQAVLNGIARIFLVDGVVTGALILVGICACSRILALAVVGGTFVASLLSLAVFDVPTWYLNAGYAGFNPALAMAGIFFYLVPSWKLTGLAFFWLILTMIATGAVDVLLDAIGIPVAMSFGFCFALLPLLSLDSESVFGPNHTLIRRIPADELSCPEEYLEKHAPPPPSKEVVDADVETGKADDDKEEDVVEVQNETTPLLSST